MPGTKDAAVRERSDVGITIGGAAGSDWAIWSDGAGHRYGKKWAVRGLDLRVPRGSIYGFLGLNGAGKSTTMRMLMGLLRVSAGHLRVASLDPMKQDIEVKRRVGYVPDTPVFYDWMTVEETCGLVAHYRKGEWKADRQAELLKRFDLQPKVQTRSLSKGQKARLSLVLALGFDPEILILDEPTLGLDPVARRQFTEGILREYAGEGKTVFVSSHLINEIAGIVDHVGIIRDGALLVQEPAETLQARFRRVELYFDGDAPTEAPASFAGSHYSASGREGILILDDATDVTESRLRELGAADYRVSQMSLEEIFMEVSRRPAEEAIHG